MIISRVRRTLIGGMAVGLVVTLAGCGSSPSTSEPSSASTAPTGAAVSQSAPVTAASSESAPASQAAASEPLGGPCDLLTPEQIRASTGVAMPDGVETIDEARQVQMCTWQSTDPFTIVAASLTDVAADEAFQTNVDLAPAYFDGEAETITLPGADKAYAVQQPDVGWVVGAVAKGRFVQVQVGGTDITQEQAATLVENAIARMPA